MFGLGEAASRKRHLFRAIFFIDKQRLQSAYKSFHRGKDCFNSDYLLSKEPKKSILRLGARIHPLKICKLFLGFIYQLSMLLIHRLALESSLFQRAALRAQPAAGVGAVDRTAARPARRGDGASRRGSRLSAGLVSRTESEGARDRLALLARLRGEDPQNLNYISCFAKKISCISGNVKMRDVSAILPISKFCLNFKGRRGCDGNRRRVALA